METKNNKISMKKFIDFSFLEDHKKLKIWRISFLGIFAFIFLLIFFFTLTNNGYRFLFNDANQILNDTFLKICVGLFCGFGLTTAGCAMQGVSRNDLAGPTTMGFMPAATLGIIVYQIIGVKSIPLMLVFSLLFALCVLVLNFFTLKSQKNNSRNYKMILSGVITGALLTTVSSILTSKFPLINQTIVPWIGSVTTNISWESFMYTAPLILIGIVMISLISKNLNIIENDPSLAKALGLNAEKTFWIAGTGTILITISSVYLIGSVSMIGIVMPHIVRMLFRTRDYRFLIPMSGVLSSTILILSIWINSVYTLGLNLFAVLISVPIFIYVIFKGKNK